MEDQNSPPDIFMQCITKDVCRVCLTSDPNNQYIFSINNVDNSDDEHMDFRQQLELHGGIEVSEHDGLPNMICMECIEKVNAAHELWELCQSTHERLQELLVKSKDECQTPSYTDNISENGVYEIEYASVEDEPEMQEIEIIEYTEEPLLTIDVETEAHNELTEESQVELTEESYADSQTELYNETQTDLPIEIQTELPAESQIEFKTESEIELQTESEIELQTESQIELEIDSQIEIKTELTDEFIPEKMQKKAKKLSMFKRVTSMANLKTSKERQRQFMKNTNSKEQKLPNTIDNGLYRGKPYKRPKRYPCKQCNRGFSSIKFLDRHTATIHKENAVPKKRIKKKDRIPVVTIPVYCDICKKDCKQIDSLLRHLPLHKKTNDLQVYEIMKKIRNERKLEEQSKLKDNETVDGDRLILANEIKEEEPTDLKSKMRLVNIWTRELLKDDNDGKGFMCPMCNKSFVIEKSMLRHQRMFHIPTLTKKVYNCDECDEYFEKQSDLRKHLRFHEKNCEYKRYLCHICSKSFRFNATLNAHVKNHSRFPCKHCELVFETSDEREEHENTHEGNKPYNCDDCGAAFTRRATLIHHMTRHTDKFRCKICSQTFRRLINLQEHGYKHTGERPFKCEICGVSYSHSGSLASHLKKCKERQSNPNAKPPRGYWIKKINDKPKLPEQPIDIPKSKTYVAKTITDSNNVTRTVYVPVTMLEIGANKS